MKSSPKPMLANTLLASRQYGGRPWAAPVFHGCGTEAGLRRLRHSENAGLAAGSLTDPGAILETGDGGRTWTVIGSLKGERVKALSFAGRKHGWALAEATESGREGTSLYKTDDGGRTWARISAADALKPGQISLTGTDTGYISSGFTGLHVTRDGGRTFEQVATVTRIGAPAFVDPDHGWALSDGKLYATGDGGKTWSPVSPGYYRPLEFSLLPGGHAWVVVNDCDGGDCKQALLSSADGGATWTRYDLGQVRPDDVAFASPTVGWLIDELGHRYATEDGGHTWHQQQ